MKLHVLKASSNNHGPLALIEPLGLHDQIEIVDSYGKTRTPEFLALNPNHGTPTLELDDGTAIWESNTVMRYMCSIADGEKGEEYYPSSQPKRAFIDMAMDWRQTTLYPKLPSIGYIAFGFVLGDPKADFASLQTEIFPVILKTFLANGKNKFIYSDTPTIADLSVALPLMFITARPKFWDAVPQDLKEYLDRVTTAFPSGQDYYDMLLEYCKNCKAEGVDMEP